MPTHPLLLTCVQKYYSSAPPLPVPTHPIFTYNFVLLLFFKHVHYVIMSWKIQKTKYKNHYIFLLPRDNQQFLILTKTVTTLQTNNHHSSNIKTTAILPSLHSMYKGYILLMVNRKATLTQLYLISFTWFNSRCNRNCSRICLKVLC